MRAKRNNIKIERERKRESERVRIHTRERACTPERACQRVGEEETDQEGCRRAESDHILG